MGAKVSGANDQLENAAPSQPVAEQRLQLSNYTSEHGRWTSVYSMQIKHAGQGNGFETLAALVQELGALQGC